jgi:hypothetical protein
VVASVVAVVVDSTAETITITMIINS